MAKKKFDFINRPEESVAALENAVRKDVARVNSFNNSVEALMSNSKSVVDAAVASVAVDEKPSITEKAWDLTKRGAESVASMATSKAAHVAVGNAIVGTGVGIVGGVFGPIGLGLTVFGYAMGLGSATATASYLMEENLDDAWGKGRQVGRLEAENNALRRALEKNKS